MSVKTNENKLMTEGSIARQIFFFSVPLILGNLLQQLYNTADSIIVGNYVGSNALAAVGSSTSLICLLIAFSQGASVGAGVIVSQYLGANNKKEVQNAVHTALAIAFFLGLILLVFFMKRREKAMLTGFLFPVIFAFVLLMTPDINVNHKYIVIAYGFLSIFWAWAICSLWGKKLWKKLLAVLLAVCLTATGIYDFVIILRGNGTGHRVTVNMNSDLTRWLADHLGKQDLLLTPEYSMNEVTMSGVMLYCGWPYYAWSAGYDTNYRADRAVEIYTATDESVLRSVVKEEKITYILFEEGSEFEQKECQEALISQTFEKVYETEDRRIRIYKTIDDE